VVARRFGHFREGIYSFCLLPSDLKEGAGSREQGAGGKNIFMLGGETCFIGTAFCLS